MPEVKSDHESDAASSGRFSTLLRREEYLEFIGFVIRAGLKISELMKKLISNGWILQLQLAQ